jgi:isopentenyl diphosphate isomerase/L-lactate dehydrogenase-like FMN-dependent dehydrogenase
MWERPPNIPLAFTELEWLKGLTTLPLIVKGVRTAEDATLCMENGVDGLLVSNHGGRQIDTTLSSIETLPEIALAVQGKMELYLDSGIRSGSDILKALALGAKAVFIGRPLFWGLAIGGSRGVRKVLSILRTELDDAMGYSGISSIEHVDATILSLPNHMKVPRNAARRKIKDMALLLNQGKITNQMFQSNKAKLLQP